MIPPKIFIHGDHATASLWVGYAKGALVKLKRDMAFQNINEGLRSLTPVPGVQVEVASSFSLQSITIRVTSGEGEQKKAEEERLPPFDHLKVWVHVDVIQKEDFAVDHTVGNDSQIYPERLVRTDIVSSVACGIMQIGTGKLAWSKAIDSLLLAQGSSVNWIGVDGYISGNVNGIIAYYDGLFPTSPFRSELPMISQEWVQMADWSNVWENLPTWQGGSGNYLKASYNCIPTQSGDYELCEKTTFPPMGWCSPTVFTHLWTLWYPHIAPNYHRAECSYGDASKYVDPLGNVGCGQKAYSYYNFWPFWGQGYNPEGHAHHFERANAELDDESLHGKKYYYYKSPVLGTMWSWFFDIRDGEQWRGEYEGNSYSYLVYIDGVPTYQTSSTWVYSGSHGLFKSINEFIEIGTDYLGGPRPYQDKVSIFPVEHYAKVGNSLNMNYTIPGGFSWYQGHVGGILCEDEVETVHDWSFYGPPWLESEDLYESKRLRTLLNVSALCGYNIDPFNTPVNPEVCLSMAQLAQLAIVQAGGVVYDNATIPEDSATGASKAGAAKAFMVEQAPVEDVDMRTFPGLIYASPLMNIRFYAIPVGSADLR